MAHALPLVASLMLASATARAEVTYSATLELPQGEEALAGTLKGVSQLVRRADQPPASRAALFRRAADDRARLGEALRALGYYAATVEMRIDREATPVSVAIVVAPGPLYLVADVTIAAPAAGPALPPDLPDPGSFGLAPGAPAASADIVTAERRIIARLGESGRPYARQAGRRVTVDHALKAVTVAWTIDAGPPARFGEATVQGLADAREAMVRRRIAWQPGETYDTRQVEATRKALAATALFSSVRIVPADRPAADGSVPMAITLVEGKRRSIGGGASYSTSTGFGAEAFWEHRDILGDGERLRLSARFAEQELGATATFRRPYFFHPDQDLVASLTLADEDPPAYENRYLRAHAGVERRFPPRWTAGAGLQYEHEEVDAQGATRRYHLLSTPVFLRYDGSDDLLNPTRGTRTTIAGTPYLGVQDSTLAFLKLRLDQTAYWRLDDHGRWVLAANAAIGSLLGATRGDVPAPQRFYAGGGGSVRGFGYQMAGPVDAADKPLGGKSLLAAGAELRIKITDTIGIVPFIEAGTVYDRAFPSFGETLFVGAGIGLRYYTGFGPVRLDIGTPLNRRRGVDDVVQFYISLGQAF
ncbi:MAG: outer membrane protein assembly factor [Alphaproteobacteria bacterium]|nr:outer membrane protein assembly factor [Alphaproteobacteria bacterium]